MIVISSKTLTTNIEDNTIEELKKSGNSLDLNLIENTWNLKKSKVEESRPCKSDIKYKC